MRCSRANGNRALGYAIAASIVLHALLLGADWPRLTDALKQPVDALAPIVARLVEPAPPPPAPAPAPQPIPRVEEEKSKPVPKLRPRVKKAPAPRIAERQEPIEASPPAAPAPAPTPAPASPPVVKAAPAPGPAPAPPAAAVPDTASLIERYRAALLAEARRHKAYPTAAVDNGWEGEVVVRMAIGADGSIAALEVRSSSGYPLLDRQAVEMFRRAKPHVALPESLRGRPFAVELRAVFNLKDQASG